MTNPIISIIIPCYNAEKWIEQCVNSALNQTYENLEVIVVDNESEDNSLKVINKLKELNPLLITSTAPNLYKYSWTEPVEEALSLASGEYFTIVGSDDYLDEKYIENIVDVIKRSNGKIEIFQSPICGIDINNLPINNGSISHSYKNLTEFKQKLFTGCPVNTPTVVYKKSIHEEGNIFWDSESFLGSADYNLYFHLADKKKFIYPIPKWLGYYYRWHSDQATWGMQKEETRYDEKIKDYWRKKMEDITVSDYIFDKLSSVGVDHVFTVTGGGAMFLNDAAHRNKKIDVVCNHHEQASAMAAVAYSKYKNNYAAVMVTTGCGSTNTVTGLLEAWQDNLPVVFISGQVNYHQTSKKFNLGLRQVGVQESDIISVVSPMTKYAKMVTNADDIKYELEKALHLARSGRPGPVWIDVPLDIQGSKIDQESLKCYTIENELNSVDLGQFEEQLRKSNRPVVLAEMVLDYQAHLGIATIYKRQEYTYGQYFLGVDLVDNNDSLNIGRVGVKGTRAANFAMQNCDMLIVIGCRLSVATTGYIYDFFAREAKVFVIDVDENEHKKDTVRIDSFIKSDAKQFLIEANKVDYTSKKYWSNKCYEWKEKWHSLSDHDIDDASGISMYYFMDQLSKNNKDDSIVVSDAGSAYYVASQALKTTRSQRYITSGAQADMGFTIPACIGASNANSKADVIGITGDGSFQTNVQELQTIKHHNYPIKIFVLNNRGYLSIRTTQRKFFNDRFVGTCKNSGVSFPKTKDICKAYGIKYFCFKTNQELQNGIKKVLNEKQPVVCEVICKEWDQVLPTISSKKTKEGKMVSKPLEDMFPFLTRKEFNDNMVIEPLLED